MTKNCGFTGTFDVVPNNVLKSEGGQMENPRPATPACIAFHFNVVKNSCNYYDILATGIFEYS